MAMSSRSNASWLGIGERLVTAVIDPAILYDAEEQGGSADAGKALTFDAANQYYSLATEDDEVHAVLRRLESDGYGSVVVGPCYTILPWNATDGEPSIGDQIEGGQTNGTVRTDNTNGLHRVVDNATVNHTGDVKTGEVMVALDFVPA